MNTTNDENQPADESVEPVEPVRESGAPRRKPIVPIVIFMGVAIVLVSGHIVFRRASAATNREALSSSARGVSVAEAAAAQFRPSRRYVGTLEPWIEARVGPQMVSAYVTTVAVRPGATVRRGDVIATLDCREASATRDAVSLQARALAARQSALAHQATRMSGLLDGGFVAPNEVEQREAESESEQARLLAVRAQIMGSALAVNDCVLRAPFDGEIGDRAIDPGAFVRPGAAIVTVVDRSTVRVAADVPETDFAAVAPGTPVHMHVIATSQDIEGTISRRSPSADPSTRTIHVEIDIPDPRRVVPVNTTAEIHLEVGQPVDATRIPLNAADVRGTHARLFFVENGMAHLRTVDVLGEAAGDLFVSRELPPGGHVVIEGRALLSDGDRVVERVLPAAPVIPAHTEHTP